MLSLCESISYRAYSRPLLPSLVGISTHGRPPKAGDEPFPEMKGNLEASNATYARADDFTGRWG